MLLFHNLFSSFSPAHFNFARLLFASLGIISNNPVWFVPRIVSDPILCENGFLPSSESVRVDRSKCHVCTLCLYSTDGLRKVCVVEARFVSVRLIDT